MHRRVGLSQLSLWPWLGVSGNADQDKRFNAFGTHRGGGVDPLEPAPDGPSELVHYHEPVLCKEVLHYLQPGPDTFALDATLGGGGHSELMLQRGAQVVALDQDPVAIAYATSRLRAHAGRFCALRGNFRRFPELLSEIGVESFDVILADIGVSSWQLNDASKGFSFMHDGPLDLRMNPDGPETAADLIRTLDAEDLERIFIEYGEEPHARRIARAIVKERAIKPILTTLELARVVETVSPRKSHRHPATLVFQALRIRVNDELGALEDFLKAGSEPSSITPQSLSTVRSGHSHDAIPITSCACSPASPWSPPPKKSRPTPARGPPACAWPNAYPCHDTPEPPSLPQQHPSADHSVHSDRGQPRGPALDQGSARPPS